MDLNSGPSSSEVMVLTLHTCLKLKLGRCASFGFFSRCSKFELSSSFSRQQRGSMLISTGNLANKVKVCSGVDGRNLTHSSMRAHAACTVEEEEEEFTEHMMRTFEALRL